MKAAIWWLRRDLRIGDNQALTAAMRVTDKVVPIFIIDPRLMASPYSSLRRMGFLLDGLQMLDSELSRRGNRLILREGNPADILANLREELDTGDIYAEEDCSPYARRRDEGVKRHLPLRLVQGVTIHPLELLKKADGSPYTKFSPFSKMWHSLPSPGKPIPAPGWIPAPSQVESLSIAEYRQSFPSSSFRAGEKEAQYRLETFTNSTIRCYAEERNRLDLEGTSRLSPYLRLGMLSARQAAWAAWERMEYAEDATSRQGAESWLNELAWREFFMAILYHFPHVRRTSFRPTLSELEWREDANGLAAWCEGQIGYPVVDAAMRQLKSSGWMHNRARMITASFLTKDLLINWQNGERYFMQQLIDGDPAANNGGWQWTAGTGADAAPYFRVFNPILQGKKFDPNGVYIRNWLPELVGVPDAFIHSPWEMPAALQRQLGCVIGRDYPAPIVEHAVARQRALLAYSRGNQD